MIPVRFAVEYDQGSYFTFDNVLLITFFWPSRW